MSKKSDYDFTECDYKEASAWLFRILMTMGYSLEEIQVRRQFAKSSNLVLFLERYNFPKLDVGHTMGFAGSICLGLEGSGSRETYKTDVDIVIVYDKCDVRYSNVDDIEHLSVSSDLIDMNASTMKNPGTLVEDIKQYPGYVKLFEINQKCKKYYSNCLSYYRNAIYKIDPQTEINGPSITHKASEILSYDGTLDSVVCRLLKGWPSVANEWLSRKRPNNWPSPEAIRVIKSQGWLIAPVGHFDSDDKNTQWRLSIKEDEYLFSQLNHIQMLCYVILKWILKTEIENIANDSICSFHIKNLIFWCAESFSCKWTKSNLLICIKKCIQSFKNCILEQKLSHYFITERNLFNSKLTSDISKDLGNLLLKYEMNILHIFKIVNYIGFNRYMRNWDYDNLTRKELISVIESCFEITYSILMFSNATLSQIMRNLELVNVCEMLNQCHKIFHYLTLNKMISTFPFICQLKSFVEAFQYAQRLPSREKMSVIVAKYFLREKIQKHLAFIVLRLALFLYMENQYEYVIQLCLKCVSDETNDAITMKYQTDNLEAISKNIQSKTSRLTTCDLYTVKEHVLASFYSTWECKPRPSSLPSSCELLSRFENLFNNYQISYGVLFRQQDINNVPEVVLFELISAEIKPKKRSKEVTLSPNLSKLLLLFLSYMETHQKEDTNTILKSMELYIDEKVLENLREDKRKFEVFYHQVRYSKNLYNNITFNEPLLEFESNSNGSCLPSTDEVYEDMHQLYNIVAYCNLKVHRYKQASNYILKSLTTCPSRRKNAAYSYLKIIICVLKEVDVTSMLTYP